LGLRLIVAEAPAAPSPSPWQSLGHPILLAEAMWNHAVSMRQTSKGCAGCHTGKLELTDIAADMCDHAPKMRQIVSYLWTEQIFRESGDPVDGKKTFLARKCAF